MMKRILLFCMLFAACSEAPERAASRAERDRQGNLIASAEIAIERQLRDPKSAQYTDVAVYRGADGVERVCGFVNAANGFGGMSGPQPFIAGGGTAHFGDDPALKLAWQQACVTRLSN